MPAAAEASQVARQLQASAGTVECVLSSTCLWGSPRGRQGSVSSLVSMGEVRARHRMGCPGGLCGLIQLPQVNVIHSGDICGAPAVPRPNARYIGAQRHAQCPWARQLAGDIKRQTGKPYNTCERCRVTPETCAPNCGAKGEEGRALQAGHTLCARAPSQGAAW